MIGIQLRKVIFGKQSGIFNKMYVNFSNLQNPYSQQNHTLMKNIFIFKQQDGYCGYIINDEASNSLICIDPGKYDVAIQNVKIMEQQLKSKLTHVLCTHKYHMTEDTEQFLKYNKDIKIVAGNKGDNKAFHNQSAQDLDPFCVGDISVCFLHTPGYSSDSYSIALTHSTESSTLYPVLFTGETLQVATIGDVEENKHSQMLKSLLRIQSFPNESLVFPARDGQIENLLFAKSLDPGNPVINLKIAIAKQAMEAKRNIVPSSLLEENNCNPFLRLSDKQILQNIEARTISTAFKQLKLKQKEFLTTLSSPSSSAEQPIQQ